MEDIKTYLKKINNSLKIKNIIFRSFIQGTFISVGASVGFSIFILILSLIFSQIKFINIVDDLLKYTKLDVLIEKQLQESSFVIPNYYRFSKYKFTPPAGFTLSKFSQNEELIEFENQFAEEILITTNKINYVLNGDYNTISHTYEIKSYKDGFVLNNFQRFDNAFVIDNILNGKIMVIGIYNQTSENDFLKDLNAMIESFSRDS